jgi:hypothetical protein
MAFCVLKRNFEIDGPASSGSQLKYMEYVSFQWHPAEAALSIFNVSSLLIFFFFFFFGGGINKNGEDCYHTES